MNESERLFEISRRIFPGGVNSPVRYYQPFPIFIRSGSGPIIRDEDGGEYIDYCLGFGPHILGHSFQPIVDAISSQARDIISPGTVNRAEQELGVMILDAVNEEQIRFASSGTEATMHAVRLARGVTGRKLIVKMEGGYHGAHDYSLIKSGSGNLTFGVPSSEGIPPEVSSTVIPVNFNDAASLEAVFRTKGNEIAGVITEPVMGNTGVIPPESGFLERIRELCDSHGSLLIFDEVITGFRFHYGSFQQIAGVRADLTTYGKIIGGGLPVGAIAGPQNLMRNLSPAGRVYQAGTFSGNPLTMRAGTVALEALRKESYEKIDLLADYLLSSMVDVIRQAGFTVTGNRVGSMFQLFFNASIVKNYTDAMKSDPGTYMKIFRSMLKEGVYLAPGQFETNFVSFSHSRNDADKTIEGLVNAVGKIGEDRGKRK
ncbi:MAG: glutamate-1-semialdehyde 2,1-aminomutase [Candidatus Thermoplasmatota archaeon]|nr:glutamate-1-semialdehyde 2,1-aminomutase [Candidatus Thermoplasmatota archaeon]